MTEPKKSATGSAIVPTTGPATPIKAPKPGIIRVCNVDAIVVRKDWNARSGNLELIGTGDEVDFGSLCESIASKGQETPVDVTEDPAKPGVYYLIAGERRVRAITKLVKEKKHNGQIIINIRPYDALDERSLNLRENLARLGMKPADICWGVWQIIKEHKKRPELGKLTQTDLGLLIGLSQSVVFRYSKIATKLQYKILEDWRSCPLTISIDTMLGIADLPKEEQRAAYNKLLRTEARPEREEGSVNRSSTLYKRAVKMGTLVGALERLEVIIEIDIGALANAVVIAALGIKLPKNATSEDTQEIVDAIIEGYNEGIKAPEVAGSEVVEEGEEQV